MRWPRRGAAISCLPAVFSRYSRDIDHDSYFYRGEVLAIVERLRIPTIDGHGAFSAQPDPLAMFPFGVSGHYSAEGYRIIANETQEQISRDGGLARRNR